MFEIGLFTLIVLFIATLLAQLFADSWLSKLETIGSQVANHKIAVVAGAALVSIVGRLLLLPLSPVPLASVHDEFSYLLAADTFARGRLTNPPHPLWVFFDTFHVLQHPSYASIYPPAQGMVLALGQVLGHPWIGVLLSMAAMCAALTWALQGWLPARWALLGSVLVILRVDFMSYWVDSYWGGAVAATGGALVLGALPRLIKRPTVLNSLWMGIGAALLANSRPVEGLLFCLPVAVLLGVRLFSAARTRLRQKAATVFVPAALILACTAAFMGYYNLRVTGNVRLFPHVLYQRLYWSSPVFIWESPRPDHVYDNPQFTEFFTVFYGSPPHSWARLSLRKCFDAWNFFLGPAYSLPFLMLPWLILDRRIRFLLVQLVWCGAWVLTVVWFSPHYAAPLTATLFILLAQGVRHLRQWNPKGFRVGVFASRLILVLALARAVSPGSEIVHRPLRGWNLQRAQIAQQLQRLPQKSLVIVHYTANHNANHEWVYNAADIDGSKVVWARDIPGRDLRPLLDYYRDRRIWVVEADATPPRLEPYTAAPATAASK